MEKVIIDSSGNTITMKYDAATDGVTINNSGVDSNFYEVGYNQSSEVLPIKVVSIYTDVVTWDVFCDDQVKTELVEFFNTNKVNKD